MDNVDETIRTLKALRDMGIRISLDDFGTGYSSLNYLNRFPIDELKIDKSFIADMSRNVDSRRVVSAIIVLAHNLKLRVIAEGVEKEEQLIFLRQNQCDEVQGYYFSKPLSSEQLSKLINKGLVVTEAGQSEIWEVLAAAQGTAVK
jgi:EAL domain-containing protein (putative c-di-GMP-specific phosphodiesterase class I)